MLRLNFDRDNRVPLTILCLGAHSDDIEIGCGATILRLLEEHRDVFFKWVIFSAKGERKSEASTSAELFLANAKDKEIRTLDFRDGFFPYDGPNIKEYFEVLKREVSPDIIFTHFRNDLHQDHRLISELTWNTFRSHLILEYEIPKYDGDLGSPNLFIEVNEYQCRKKVGYLMSAFKSQSSKHWFSEDLFRALLRIRGAESGTQAKYAEGFYCRKCCI